MNATKKIYYFLAVFIIGLISAYDNTLTLIFGSCIKKYEQNPVGLWLIELSDGNQYLFIFIKAITTIIVVIICFFLLYSKYRICISFVLIFQLTLFIYLTLKPHSFDYKDPSREFQIISDESPVKHVYKFYTDPNSKNDYSSFSTLDLPTEPVERGK